MPHLLFTVFSRLSESCFLYGVFDGHAGERASEFVSQRLPAEILLGQLDKVESDEDVKTVLQQVRMGEQLVSFV